MSDTTAGPEAPFTRRCALGPVEMHALDIACTPLARAYGMPYLVGSVMTRRDPRDVDVRLILPDDHPMFTDRRQTLVLNLAVSHMLRASTGLPIDFQFQSQTEANEHNKVRNPICGRWDQSFAMHAAPPAPEHAFQPVAGHPDDDECTYREDGTDRTYCGESREVHP